MKYVYGAIAFVSAVMALGFVGNMEVGVGNDTLNFLFSIASLGVCYIACKIGKIGNLA